MHMPVISGVVSGEQQWLGGVKLSNFSQSKQFEKHYLKREMQQEFEPGEICISVWSFSVVNFTLFI